MDRIDRYEEYRGTGRALNEKLLDTIDDDGLMEAARLLGMTVEEGGEEVLYHDGELDMAIHSDFAIHELETDGTTPLERFHERERWETPLEKEIVTALRESETSLFEITSVFPEERLLVVEDVLEREDTPLELTDLNLSQTAHTGALVFFRPVQFDDLTITSGFLFPFESDYKQHLRSVYEQTLERTESRSESARRFYTFYRLYEKYGSTSLML